MTREEIANTISHGLGLVLALVAVPILIAAAIRAGNVQFTVGVSVFGSTMVLLYLASTLYHSLTHEAAKQLFRLFDHTAIFLLIAGTYTPFSLGVLRGPWGWSLLALVPVPGILLILAGGMAYTGGLAFFAAHRIRYNHFIWHLFVIAGTTCHFFAVLWYG